MLADKESVLIRGVQSKKGEESGMCEWAEGDGYQAVPKGFVLYSCLFQEALSLSVCHRGFWPKLCLF